MAPKFGRFRSAGGSAFVPEIELKATVETAKRLQNMTMPANNPGKFQRELDKLTVMVLHNVGLYAAKTAKSALIGGGFGPAAMIASALQPASELTLGTRKVHRHSQHPLREWENLAKAIGFHVDKGGMAVTVGVQTGKRSAIHSRSPGDTGQRSLELWRLMAALEEGFTITITARMHKYFLWQARNFQINARGKEEEGWKDVNTGKRTGLAAKWTYDAIAWAKLYGIPVGTHLDVPARPVLAPSMQLAMDHWKQHQAGQFVSEFGRLWVDGVAAKSTPSSGVSAGVK